MSRQPKPFFRQQTQSWYFSTGGKQYPLGKDREAAFQKFHQLMASTQQLPAEVITVNDLAQAALSPTTYSPPQYRDPEPRKSEKPAEPLHGEGLAWALYGRLGGMGCLVNCEITNP